MPAHFSKDFDLEAIRYDLHKILSTIGQLLPTKPVPEMPETPKVGTPWSPTLFEVDDEVGEGQVFDGLKKLLTTPDVFSPDVSSPALVDVPEFVSDEARARAGRYYSGVHYGKRTPRPVGISTPTDAMTPSSDCAMTPHPVEPFANYPLRTNITIAPVEPLVDSLVDSLRAEIARVTSEWRKLSRKHDILLLKLRDIHAISSDPS